MHPKHELTIMIPCRGHVHQEAYECLLTTIFIKTYNILIRKMYFHVCIKVVKLMGSCPTLMSTGTNSFKNSNTLKTLGQHDKKTQPTHLILQN